MGGGGSEGGGEVGESVESRIPSLHKRFFYFYFFYFFANDLM